MGSSNSLFVPDPEANWWPQDLGAPNAVGSQNNVRYAYFANSRRLAVKTGNNIWVYDTGDHQIGGFSQQQGSGGSITFTSQYGVVNLSTLPVISQNGVTPPAPVVPQPVAEQNSCSTPIQNEESVSIPLNATNDSIPASLSGDDILAMLERLGGLCDKNYITKEEFAAKKAELLKRL